MYIPRNVKLALDMLHKNNYEAYLVGGCLRDYLSNNVPKDYDLTTNALPDEIREVFSDYKLINNNGEKHGTVTVMIKGEGVEITTFRSESNYSDHRHPDKVTFVKDLYTDLARRDFTINAIAYDGVKIIDPYGGKNDLINGVLRAVGDPMERFDEDALRILRALRFSAKYDLTIDKSTREAMIKLSSSLRLISAERIQSELNKIVTSPYVDKLNEPYVLDILSTVIPITGLSFKTFDDYRVGIAYLLKDVKEPREVLTKLRYSTKDIQIIEFLIKYRNTPITDKELFINKVYQTTKGITREFIDLLEKLRGIKFDYKEEDVLTLKTLKIDGLLIAILGYRGVEIGEELRHLLDLVTRGVIPNDRKKLAEQAVKEMHK
jgi:tRNA nucleotidyltransferase (CCA-adding enzyme)